MVEMVTLKEMAVMNCLVLKDALCSRIQGPKEESSPAGGSPGPQGQPGARTCSTRSVQWSWYSGREGRTYFSHKLLGAGASHSSMP